MRLHPATATRFALAFALAAGLVSGHSGEALAGRSRTLFTFADPRGDDYGDGSLVYPNRPDLKKGDLDLLSFSARQEKGGTEFEATFANPVTPTNHRTIDIGGGSLDTIARFGFYTINVDVYIDTDHVRGSGSVKMLPGRRAEVAPDNAWEKAICLTPRPYEARDRLKAILARFSKERLKSEQGRVDAADLKAAKGKIAEDIDQEVFFPTRIRVAGRSIRFFVPDSFLGGPAAGDWAYVIAVSGADVEERFDLNSTLGISEKEPDRLMILPAASGQRMDRFGGAREDDDLQPPLIDILAPAGTRQEELLKDYDLRAGRPVRLPGLVPDREAPAKK